MNDEYDLQHVTWYNSVCRAVEYDNLNLLNNLLQNNTLYDIKYYTCIR